MEWKRYGGDMSMERTWVWWGHGYGGDADMEWKRY